MPYKPYKNKKLKLKLSFFIFLTLFGSSFVSSRSSSENASDLQALQAQEAKYLANIKQLTFEFEGEKSGEAYFSPDAKSIIFQSVRDGVDYYRIYSMRLDGSNPKLISTNNGKTTCSYFSPDGKKLIYASTHLNPNSIQRDQEDQEKKSASKGRYQWDFDPSFDIFAADLDGFNLVRLTETPGYDAEGSYSHDGTKIVFTSQRDGDLEIYTMNADSSHQTRITQAKGYDGGPFFSPDDTQVVFRGFRSEDGSAQIFLINADGSNERQLTNSKAVNWCPYFHPDGKRIVFSSNLDGGRKFELFLMNVDGGGVVRLTYNEAFDALPAFSPDGKKLMWTSTRNNGKSQIFIADFIDPSDPNVGAKHPEHASPLPTPDVTSDELKKYVYYLASDGLEGRMTGTIGAEKAAKYIAEEYAKYGLQSVGDNDSYYQNFEFISGVKLGGKNWIRLVLKNKDQPDQSGQILDYQPERDFRPLAFSSEGQFEADVVFAGYGITAPELGYDDYAQLDVSGKTVLIFRYTPEGDNPHSKFYKYAPLRYKALTAREKGAKALLIVTGPLNDKEDILIPLRHDSSFSDSGLFVYSVSRKVAKDILQASGRNLDELQNHLDSNKQPDSFQIAQTRFLGSVALTKEKKGTSNVVGYLPGKNDELLIIGAHYDHLGRGTEASLASKLGEIHNGADDNASGVAGLLELAEAFSAIRGNLVRGLLFIAFSGEEIGVLGSNYYTKHPIFPLEKTICMINMDMIGRLKDNKLAISGIATASDWKDLVLRYNQLPNFKFELSLKDDGYGPSDHSMFYAKDIPILFFFTGAHEDYHKPSDDADKINYDGERRIVRLIFAIAKAINNLEPRPTFVKVSAPSQEQVATRGFRVYMGTIPDYVEQVEGVKLSGVREGSPAAKAGIQAGDIIIGFGDKKIKNVYDYTYALQEHKPNDTVTVTVLREDKELKFQVTLGRRE